MAPEDERDLIEAVVTCEGNLHDPDFSDRFQSIVTKLKSILYTTSKKQPFQVRKIEPWNSVRVTISIPKEAAQRLRLLAQQGSNVLRQLGILSVQVEGDQVISLTLAGRFNEPQEVILRQSNDVASSSSSSPAPSLCSTPSSSSSSSSSASSVPAPIVPVAGPSGVMVSLDILSSSTSSAFRSPNVVAPSGESIPFPPKNAAVGPRPTLGGPFPFASMTHAAHTMQRSETSNTSSTQISSVTNSTNSTTAPSSSNANSTPAPATTVIPVPVTSGQHVRSNSTVVSVSSPTPPPPSLATTQQLSATARSKNNNNNVNSPNVNVVSKPQPVLVTAVVNVKNNSNINNNGSSQNNNGKNNSTNSSFIPPSTPPNVVVVVNNTTFSKPAQVQGDAKLNPSQQVQHLQQHHHSKLHAVLKTSVVPGVTHSLIKDNKEPTPPPIGTPTTAQLTSTGKPRQFLINPLTGHLEPMPSESSSDSEGDEGDSSAPTVPGVHSKSSHILKSSKGKDNPALIAGWDKLSLPPPKPVKITLDALKFNRLTGTPGAVGVISRKSREDLETGTPLAKEISVAHVNNTNPVDKIKKLRLKLDKTESLLQASYKMDVPYLKKSEKSSVSTVMSSSGASATSAGQFSTNNPTTSVSSGLSALQSTSVASQSDVPRVPPLHISLRGKNAAVVVSPRRDDAMMKDLPSSAVSNSPSSAVSAPTSHSGDKLLMNLNAQKQPTPAMTIKRTKIRLKSSEGECLVSSKKAGKNVQSRPICVSVEEREDPLKARLKSEEKLNSTVVSSEFNKATINKYAAVSDLISGNPGANANALVSTSLSANTSATMSGIPPTSNKIKKHRRKSDVSSPRQIFISSQSHDREFNNRSPPNAVAEASQLMKLLSQHSQQQVTYVKDEGVFEQVPTTSSMPTTVPSSTAPLLSSSSMLSTLISCDSDKDREKRRFLPPQATVATVMTTSKSLSSNLVTAAMPPGADNAISNFPTDEHLGQKTTTPVEVSDIPKQIQGSSVEVEITSTAIPDTQLSKSPCDKPIPNLVALPLPPISLDSNKLEVIPSQSLLFSLSSTTSSQSPIFATAPPSQLSSVSTGTILTPIITTEVMKKSSEVSGGPVPITHSAIVKSPVSQLVMGYHPPTDKPLNTHVLSTSAGTPSISTTSTIPTSSSNLLQPSVQSLGSSILNQMLTGRDNVTEQHLLSSGITTKVLPTTTVTAATVNSTCESAKGSLSVGPTISTIATLGGTRLQNTSVTASGEVKSSVTNLVSPMYVQKSELSTNVGDNNVTHSVSQKVVLQDSEAGSFARLSELGLLGSEGKEMLMEDRTKTIGDVISENKQPASAYGIGLSCKNEDVVLREAEADREVDQCLTGVMAAPNTSSLPVDPLPLRLMALSLPSTTGVTAPSVGGKSEDQSGIPGEDSGIDSMDALSEKSPNQGESPARKSENDHQFCDNSASSNSALHQHQHQLLKISSSSPASDRSASDFDINGTHLRMSETTSSSGGNTGTDRGLVSISSPCGNANPTEAEVSESPVSTVPTSDLSTGLESVVPPTVTSTADFEKIENTQRDPSPIRNQVPLSLPSSTASTSENTAASSTLSTSLSLLPQSTPLLDATQKDDRTLSSNLEINTGSDNSTLEHLTGNELDNIRDSFTPSALVCDNNSVRDMHENSSTPPAFVATTSVADATISAEEILKPSVVHVQGTESSTMETTKVSLESSALPMEKLRTQSVGAESLGSTSESYPDRTPAVQTEPAAASCSPSDIPPAAAAVAVISELDQKISASTPESSETISTAVNILNVAGQETGQGSVSTKDSPQDSEAPVTVSAPEHPPPSATLEPAKISPEVSAPDRALASVISPQTEKQNKPSASNSASLLENTSSHPTVKSPSNTEESLKSKVEELGSSSQSDHQIEHKKLLSVSYPSGTDFEMKGVEGSAKEKDIRSLEKPETSNIAKTVDKILLVVCKDEIPGKFNISGPKRVISNESFSNVNPVKPMSPTVSLDVSDEKKSAFVVASVKETNKVEGTKPSSESTEKELKHAESAVTTPKLEPRKPEVDVLPIPVVEASPSRPATSESVKVPRAQVNPPASVPCLPSAETSTKIDLKVNESSVVRAKVSDEKPRVDEAVVKNAVEPSKPIIDSISTKESLHKPSKLYLNEGIKSVEESMLEAEHVVSETVNASSPTRQQELKPGIVPTHLVVPTKQEIATNTVLTNATSLVTTIASVNVGQLLVNKVTTTPSPSITVKQSQKELEEVKLKVKVDASTSTRTASNATAAVIYPTKCVNSIDDTEKVQAIVHSAPNNSSLMTQSQLGSSELGKLIDAKLKPLNSSNLIRGGGPRKDIQLPVLIPAPTNTIRGESQVPAAFNSQGKPQMPSITPMQKIKVTTEAPTISTTSSEVVINSTKANLVSVAHHEAVTTASIVSNASLAPILIRPNFQTPISFTLDQHQQHKQNQIPRQSIEISLPSKVDVKPSVNINVPRAVSNVIQLTKAAAANLTNKGPITVSGTQGHTVSKSSPISVSLGPLMSTAGLSTTAGTPTVFAIHPHQYHHQPGITVLPSGQKMVPIKLVTIPKQNQAQLPLQTVVGSNRSSPTVLETMNLVAATSRSSSPNSTMSKPKMVHGNAVQNSSLNLSSVSGGNLHLVPITVSSATATGTSSPVKVLVSSPVKMQPNLLQSMLSKGQIVMANQSQAHATTIRVVRPIMAHDLSAPKLEAMTRLPSPQQPQLQKQAIVETKAKTVQLETPPAVVVAGQGVADKNSIYERADGVQVLDTGDTNEDEMFPFEADIIHDEKDLADVLADASVCVTENGIELDGPYDIAKTEKERGGTKNISKSSSDSHAFQNFSQVKEESTKSKYSNSTNTSATTRDLKSAVAVGSETAAGTAATTLDADIDKLDSPIPAIRASSPLYTYSNRSARNSHSRSESRSPSPPEPDVHGEDQEIIDCLSRSPSQPKLSPQNKPLSAVENDNDYGSPTKPDLHPDHTYGVGTSTPGSDNNSSNSSRKLEQLSIEIPPVDMMAMSPAATEESRKHTRSTRSNTRLVSPDITAFRSDTPKPTKFTNKPDALLLRNSPKPSPTGSIKTHSPGLGGIQPTTSARASPVPNQLALNSNSGIHPVTGRNSPNIISSNLSTRGTGSGGTTAFINKRKRQESDSSSASKDENSEDNKVDIDLHSRPGKRRCSENAAELIKACIGVEDTPKRNSSLIKKLEQQDTKNKDAANKTKRSMMSVVVEETEDDLDPVDLLNRGRTGGRSSRGSSEDRSSSRGSSVHRNTATPKPNAKEEENKDTKSSRVNNRTMGTKDTTNKSKGSGRDSPSSNVGKKDDSKQVGRRSNRNAPTKEKSPLTLAKTRTNVRKEPVLTTGTEKPATPSTSPENGNPRRKTRSSVAGGASDSMPSFKRRRISKDAKS